MAQSRHFIVSGRVQGVWFRAATREQAALQGICGWVRNLPDGRVEGIARGEAAALAEFHRWLQRGPQLAKVLSVEWREAPDEEFAGFTIR